MRTILQTAAKMLAVFLWIVKGLLLLLAVGVLLLWPMSCGRNIGAGVHRWDAGPELTDYRYFGTEFRSGRILIGGGLLRTSKSVMNLIPLSNTVTPGSGWRWVFISMLAEPVGRSLSSSFGPLQWEWNDSTGPDIFQSNRVLSAPCWLVAPLLALWPLSSLTFLFRRRRKRRRLALIGCCEKCGYDLRATAEKNGPLLPRCPECGAETPAASLLTPRSRGQPSHKHPSA